MSDFMYHFWTQKWDLLYLTFLCSFFPVLEDFHCFLLDLAPLLLSYTYTEEIGALHLINSSYRSLQPFNSNIPPGLTVQATKLNLERSCWNWCGRWRLQGYSGPPVFHQYRQGRHPENSGGSLSPLFLAYILALHCWLGHTHWIRE